MSFTPTQVRKLRSKLRPQHVRTREAEGISLSYLEGWHVLAEANRIFGFDGWDRETISSECVWTKQVSLSTSRKGSTVSVSTSRRLPLRAALGERPRQPRVRRCQSALKRDPLSASKRDPPIWL